MPNVEEVFKSCYLSINTIDTRFMVLAPGCENPRTIRVNTLFREIAIQSKVLDETKNDNLFLDCHFGSNVGKTGLLSLFQQWGMSKYK
jgi:hypothetical protein